MTGCCLVLADREDSDRADPAAQAVWVRSLWLQADPADPVVEGPAADLCLSVQVAVAGSEAEAAEAGSGGLAGDLAADAAAGAEDSRETPIHSEMRGVTGAASTTATSR